MNTSSFTFYLLPTLLRHFFPSKFAKSSSSGDTNLAPYHSLPTDDSPPASLTSPTYVDERIAAPVDKLSTRETAKLATQWCVVWFIANWAVNASLGWTSVASVTILSSTAGVYITLRDPRTPDADLFQASSPLAWGGHSVWRLSIKPRFWLWCSGASPVLQLRIQTHD